MKTKKKKKLRMRSRTKFLLIAIVALSILTVMVVATKNKNGLKLLGDKIATINLEEDYIEEGVMYKDKDVTKDTTIKQMVNNKKQGTYKITYTYKNDKGKTLKATRKIIVKDLTLPELTLTGGSEFILNKGSKFIEPGYTAIDNVDKDITQNVKVNGTVDSNKEGSYTLTYEVSDKSGNVAKKKRKVTVTTKSPLTMSVEEFTLDGLFEDTILQEKEAQEGYMENMIYAGDSMVLYYDINKLVSTEQLWYKNSIDPKSAKTATLYHTYKDTGKTMVELYQEEQPEYSIITLGTNSVAYMEMDDFIENYKSLLQDIKKVSPKTKLIVQSIPPVDKRKDLENSPINNDKINKFNYEIVKMCSELGIKFLNSAVAMKDENGYAKQDYCIDYDGIHPSKEGHTALYEYTKHHAY